MLLIFGPDGKAHGARDQVHLHRIQISATLLTRGIGAPPSPSTSCHAGQGEPAACDSQPKLGERRAAEQAGRAGLGGRGQLDAAAAGAEGVADGGAAGERAMKPAREPGGAGVCRPR
jgi:hypothetical protein